MTPEILGLPLASALERLKAAGVEPIEITEVSAPRGHTPRGTLRVLRAQNGGRALTVARFPDDAEENARENA